MRKPNLFLQKCRIRLQGQKTSGRRKNSSYYKELADKNQMTKTRNGYRDQTKM